MVGDPVVYENYASVAYFFQWIYILALFLGNLLPD